MICRSTLRPGFDASRISLSASLGSFILLPKPAAEASPVLARSAAGGNAFPSLLNAFRKPGYGWERVAVAGALVTSLATANTSDGTVQVSFSFYIQERLMTVSFGTL